MLFIWILINIYAFIRLVLKIFHDEFFSLSFLSLFIVSCIFIKDSFKRLRANKEKIQRQFLELKKLGQHKYEWHTIIGDRFSKENKLIFKNNVEVASFRLKTISN